MTKDRWITVLLFFIVISFLFWMFEREFRLQTNHRFTIATTVGHSGGGWVDYEFTVNGVVYKRGDKGLSLKSRKAKYFVKYYTPDPSILAKIVSDQEVPNCIGEPPPNGWAEVPSCE